MAPKLGGFGTILRSAYGWMGSPQGLGVIENGVPGSALAVRATARAGTILDRCRLGKPAGPREIEERPYCKQGDERDHGNALGRKDEVKSSHLAEMQQVNVGHRGLFPIANHINSLCLSKSEVGIFRWTEKGICRGGKIEGDEKDDRQNCEFHVLIEEFVPPLQGALRFGPVT